MSPDPRPPGVERELGIQGVRSHLPRAATRDDPFDAGREDVDLAHLGRIAVPDQDGCVVGRQPPCPAGPGGRVGRRPARVPRPERQLDGRPGRRLLTVTGQLEPARQHGIDDHPVALEVDVEELARARDARDPLARERRDLGRGAPDGQGHQRPAGRDGPAREGGVQRIGDDGEIGQLGHGWRLYPRTRGARLARPMGTDS